MADFKDFLAARSSASLAGTDSIPVVSGGVTKKTTPAAIIALAAGDYDAAGTAASAVATHVAAADPHPAYALESALGTAAAAATADFAPAAQGVTNGNSHDHSGGDGAQIAYSSLSGLPTLGGAAALNVGTGAGTVAAGDDVRLSPRIVTATISGGAIAIDCANAPNVIVLLTLNANVTAGVTYSNVPTACQVEWYITQSGGPYTFTSGQHPSGTVVSSYYLYTDSTVTRLWASTKDGGTSWDLESNVPSTVQRAAIEYAPSSVVTITGNTTLTQAAHQGKALYCTTAALSLTVDNNTDFDAYAICEIINKTGAVVTMVATATINRVSGKPLTIPANGRAILMREATADVYLLTGEMA